MTTATKETTKIICPRCKSKRTWRKGYNPTRQGCRQRFVCFDCGKTFYHDSEHIITEKEYEKRTAHMPSHWDRDHNTGLCPSIE